VISTRSFYSPQALGRTGGLLLVAFTISTAPLKANNHSRCPCPSPIPLCQTVYRAGDNSADLQVHIVGPGSSTLEVYFNENLQRYAVPGDIDLCRYGAVLMPDKNTFGTFAIRYGPNGFTAFGWKGASLVPLTAGRNEYPQPNGTNLVIQIDLEPDLPIDFCWVTTRIARIVHGPNLDQVYILRYDGDAQPWKLLYSGPVRKPAQP
jgi:hypothetical protein